MAHWTAPGLRGYGSVRHRDAPAGWGSTARRVLPIEATQRVRGRGVEMIIATFGASTAWLGKTITFDDGRFMLEDLGQIQPQAVVEYDRQGHLQWAYDGLREWVYQTAGEAPAAIASAASLPATPAVAPPAPAGGVVVQGSEPNVAPHVAPETAPAAGQAYTPAAPQPPAAPGPPPAAAAPGPPPAAAAAPAPGVRKSPALWLILGGVVVLALLIGFVVAGGRPRDALGVAFTAARSRLRGRAGRRAGQAGRVRSLAARRGSAHAAAGVRGGGGAVLRPRRRALVDAALRGRRAGRQARRARRRAGDRGRRVQPRAARWHVQRRVLRGRQAAGCRVVPPRRAARAAR